MPVNACPDGPKPGAGKSLTFSPVSLPCGRIVQNRLVKVAMYEHLASFNGGPPNPHHYSLYSKWAKYNWGIVITGNVQVCASHLTLGRDMVIPSLITEETLQPFRALAAAMHNKHPCLGSADTNIRDPRTLAIMQLSHAGRQSANIIGGRFPFVPPLGPSPIAVGHDSLDTSRPSKILHRLLFQTPRPMSSADIDDVVLAFVRGSEVAVHAGFDGVQLHVAHGLSSVAELTNCQGSIDLLSQFISPKSNDRTDCYASTHSNSLNLLRRIVFGIRRVVPSDFVLGVKINSADYLDRTTEDDTVEPKGRQYPSPGRKTITRALEHVRTISLWGNIDFIEISGGDYENPEFMATIPTPRQALFADFSKRAMEVIESLAQPKPLILLTGGLRTPYHLYSALASQHTHLLGLGRGSVLCPDLPEILGDRDENDRTPFALEPSLEVGPHWLYACVWTWLPKVKLVGAGMGMAWYIIRIRHIAIVSGTADKDIDMSGIEAVLRMWLWIGYGGIGKPGRGLSLVMCCCVAITVAILLRPLLAR